MEKPFRAYQGDEPYVFVCYAHDDARLVYAEITRLHEAGFHIWYDEGVSPGSEWSESLAHHIQECAVFLYFVTPRSVEREHCRQEVNFATSQDRPILTVHLERTIVPAALQLSLSHRQAILKPEHSRQAYEDKLTSALAALVGHEQAPKPTPRSFARRRLLLASLVGFVLTVSAALAVWLDISSQIDSADHAVSGAMPGNFNPSVGVAPVRVVGEDPRLTRYAQTVELELVEALSKTPLTVVGVGQGSPDYLIVCSVRYGTDGPLVSYQISKAKDGQVLWSNSMPFSFSEPERFAKAPALAYLARTAVTLELNPFLKTESGFARREVLRAVFEFAEISQGGEGDYLVAERRLRTALADDPGLVSPYFDLGILYKNRLGMRLTYEQAVDSAYDSVRRILSVYPDWTFLAGTINTQLELDFDAAVANFEHARLHEWGFTQGEIDSEIGFALLYKGDIEGALAQLAIANRLDSGANRIGVHWAMASAYLASNRYREALETLDGLEGALEGSSTVSIDTHRLRIFALHHLGRHEEASAALDLAWQLYGADRPHLFAGVMGLLGREEHAREIIQQSKLRFAKGELPTVSEAFWGEFHLGNIDEAFVWLNRTIENREFWFLPMLRHSDTLDSIRDDPRFKAAMQRLDEIESSGTQIRTVAIR